MAWLHNIYLFSNSEWHNISIQCFLPILNILYTMNNLTFDEKFSHGVGTLPGMPYLYISKKWCSEQMSTLPERIPEKI